MAEVIEIERIMEMIPHRVPFLWIDRAVDVVKGERATGIKCVSMNEPIFTGHFPGAPVFPGVLIIEAMAQTSAVLVVHTLGKDAEGKVVYFMGIENAKFRKPVKPGDRMEIKVEIMKGRRNIWKLNCTAEVDGAKVAEGIVQAMIMDQKIKE